MTETKNEEIKCYECHFRCYCGKAKQEKAMSENCCQDYYCIHTKMYGYSSWGSYFSEPGY